MRQIRLTLDDPLREAFHAARLDRRMSYRQALASRPVRKCLQIMARVQQKKGSTQCEKLTRQNF